MRRTGRTAVAGHAGLGVSRLEAVNATWLERYGDTSRRRMGKGNAALTGAVMG